MVSSDDRSGDGSVDGLAVGPVAGTSPRSRRRVREHAAAARDATISWLRERFGPKRARTLTVLVRATIIILAFIVLLYALLVLYFRIGEDLTLELSSNQTSFTITNREDANARIMLSTHGQLFCDTQCSTQLLRVSDESVLGEWSSLTKSGNPHVQDVTLSPPRRGEGQQVYSFTATCTNIPSLLCPSLAPQRRETVLLALNYGLAGEESEQRPLVRAQLEEALGALQRTEIALTKTATLLAKNPRLRVGTELARSIRLQDEFDLQRIEAERLRTLWGDEAYDLLADELRESVLIAANGTRDGAAALLADTLVLGTTHNAIRDGLDAARRDIAALLATYPDVASIAQPTVAELDRAIAQYDENEFAYPAMRARVEQLSSNVTALATTLAAENTTMTAEFASLLAEQASTAAWVRSDLQYPPLPIPVVESRPLAQWCAELRNSTANLVRLTAELRSNTSNITGSNDTVDDTSNATNATNTTSDAVSRLAAIDALIARSDDLLVKRCSPMPSLSIDNRTLVGVDLAVPEVNSSIIATLSDNPPQCCVFGECRACCNTAVCADDPSTYPVILVHGHSFNGWNSVDFSLGGYFALMQQHLQRDGYLDAGVVAPTDQLSAVGPGEWGLSGRPVAVRVTYYYNYYQTGTQYTLVAQKSENIETYAIRLKELVDLVEHHTGKKKVRIVAHSMGGLVARRYVQLFGEEDVDALILVGTPNHGITARTKTLCPVFGEGKECDDMEVDSVFLRKLNDPGDQPSKVRIVTIAGSGCRVGGEDGDGVVTVESVRLPTMAEGGPADVTNYVVNGTCDDFFGSELHTELLNEARHPDVYGIIRDELKK